MRFGTWNNRSLYRTEALDSVISEIEKYKIDLVGVQEIRWKGQVTLDSGNYSFNYGECDDHQLEI